MIYEGLKDGYSAADQREMVEKRNAQCPTGTMGDAWDVANAMVFLASDEARYITGQNLVVDGGITCKMA
ncbi:MAG: SDR family oxidoreductase [Arhodomonas sp.]|nr:SDR family oxidoreductase [Arhodomonas sp.]